MSALTKEQQERLSREAMTVLGAPYRRGSKWPELWLPTPGLTAEQYPPIDCSGLSKWLLLFAERKIPHGSLNQYNHCLKKENQWRPTRNLTIGCLGFSDGSDADPDTDHVVVYVGEGRCVEARGNPHNKVILTPAERWERWKGWQGWWEPI